GDPQPLDQLRAAALVEHDRADPIEAQARNEVIGALAVVGVLAVVLKEGGADAERLGARVHRAQDVALSDIAAGGAADAHLPATLDCDHTDVLDGRLGAVARAAGDARLDLVRGVQALPG